MKLNPHFPSPIPHRNTFAAVDLRRHDLFAADDPTPVTVSGTQVHPEVRLDPLNLSGPLDLAAGDHRRRNRPVNPLLPSDPTQGPNCFVLNLSEVLSVKVQTFSFFFSSELCKILEKCRKIRKM